MPIHGIGVDLLHVPRLVTLMRRRGSVKLASRILSTREQQVFRVLKLHVSEEESIRDEVQPRMDTVTQFLGVRWAVKEAAYKALYPFRPTWKQLTYTGFDSQNGSKPTLTFDPHPTIGIPLNAAWTLHVSVSHDGEYIVANVVAETRG